MVPADVINTLKTSYFEKDWDGVLSVILALEARYGHGYPLVECGEVLVARAHVAAIKASGACNGESRPLFVSREHGEA